MAGSDFSKLPRLQRRKGIYLYWRDSELGPDGKRKLIALGRADDPQALARYHQIEAEYNGPQNTLNWLFTRFESAFLGDTPGNQGLRQVKLLAPKTRREYRKQLRALRENFGVLRIDGLRPGDVQLFLQTWPSPISANRHIALLSRIYSWACGLQLTEKNPCEKKLAPRNEQHPRTRYITDEEYLARREVASDWMAATMDLGYLTALRLGDLLSIRLQPPSPTDEHACWLAPEALYAQPAKTFKRTPRCLNFTLEGALAEVVRTLLDIWSRRPVQGMYLICNRRGQPYTVNGFESMWQRLKKRDGNSTFQFRDIRAKSATDAEAAGHNAQLLLGHASPNTTEIYLRAKRMQKAQGPVLLPAKAKVLRFPGPANEPKNP